MFSKHGVTDVGRRVAWGRVVVRGSQAEIRHSPLCVISFVKWWHPRKKGKFFINIYSLHSKSSIFSLRGPKGRFHVTEHCPLHVGCGAELRSEASDGPRRVPSTGYVYIYTEWAYRERWVLKRLCEDLAKSPSSSHDSLLKQRLTWPASSAEGTSTKKPQCISSVASGNFRWRYEFMGFKFRSHLLVSQEDLGQEGQQSNCKFIKYILVSTWKSLKSVKCDVRGQSTEGLGMIKVQVS